MNPYSPPRAPVAAAGTPRGIVYPVLRLLAAIGCGILCLTLVIYVISPRSSTVIFVTGAILFVTLTALTLYALTAHAPRKILTWLGVLANSALLLFTAYSMSNLAQRGEPFLDILFIAVPAALNIAALLLAIRHQQKSGVLNPDPGHS